MARTAATSNSPRKFAFIPPLFPTRSAQYSIRAQRFDTACALSYDAWERRNVGPIGIWEMVFIGLLALLIFGPRKLPELGRTLGKALTEFRRASTELKSTIEDEVRQLEQETQKVSREVEEAATSPEGDARIGSLASPELPVPADPPRFMVSAAEPYEEKLPDGDTKPA